MLETPLTKVVLRGTRKRSSFSKGFWCSGACTIFPGSRYSGACEILRGFEVLGSVLGFLIVRGIRESSRSWRVRGIRRRARSYRVRGTLRRERFSERSNIKGISFARPSAGACGRLRHGRCRLRRPRACSRASRRRGARRSSRTHELGQWSSLGVHGAASCVYCPWCVFPL